LLIKFYKEIFCKKEEHKEEKCPYLEWVEEQEKVLKHIDSLPEKREDKPGSSIGKT
tara:strand:+ start:820 stop:987 length:168 start_codon:yes stop_codon:yes gene_type:complete